MKNSRYRTRYRIQYSIRCHIRYLKLSIAYHLKKWHLPGPAPAIALENSDDDQDQAWSGDQRDFEDQLSAPQSPMAYYPGSRNSLARFLSDVPDWCVLDSV